MSALKASALGLDRRLRVLRIQNSRPVAARVSHRPGRAGEEVGRVMSAGSETVSGEGVTVHRQRVELSDTTPCDSRTLSIPADLTGRKWVRLEVLAWRATERSRRRFGSSDAGPVLGLTR